MENISRPEVSFVVIEYNCIEDVCGCIASVAEHCNGLSYEVVVSSNSLYGLEGRKRAVEKVPNVRWLFHDKNLGFAGGMNAGLRSSSADCLVIMNPDVRLLADARPMYEYLMNHPGIGAIGPRIEDKAGHVQDSCRRFMTPGILMQRVMKRIVKRRAALLDERFDYDKTQPVDWIIGAFMMLRRSAMEKVGLFDEGYFLYVEDMDWCKRFWDSGWQIIYYPRFVVEYQGDRKSTAFMVSKGIKPKYTFYHIKSYLRFLRKHKLFLSVPRPIT